MQQSDCSLSGERRDEGEEVSFSNSDHVLSLLPAFWPGQTTPQQNWKSLKRGRDLVQGDQGRLGILTEELLTGGDCPIEF